MKTMNVSLSGFTPVTNSDAINITGGGFAYDVGRAIRYLIIASGGLAGQVDAIAECIALSYLNRQ